MSERRNKILIAAIALILIACCFVLYRYFFDYSFIMVLITGAALILLSFTKQKPWAMVLGFLLIFFSIDLKIPHERYFFHKMVLAAALFCSGTSLLYAGIKFPKSGRIMLGSFALCGSLFVMLECMPFFHYYVCYLFVVLCVIAVGLCFVFKRIQRKKLEK